MILTGEQIYQEYKLGKITLDPFMKKHMNPNSYNYRLDKTLLFPKKYIVDLNKEDEWEKITISSSGYLLQPNRLYLGSTVEEIGSNTYVPSLIGRSSLGRLGLFLQITADLGHIGTKHKWTLELKVVQPLVVYPYMIIGQVSFWEPYGLHLLNGVQYRNQEKSYAHFSKPQVAISEKFY